MKRCIYFSILLLFFSIVHAKSTSAQIPDSSAKQIEYYTAKFRAILETINTHYDDTVDIAKLSDKCFNSMLSSLDPFSRYFPNYTWKTMLDESKGESVGVGITLFSFNDTLTVINVSNSSSAHFSDIRTGDKVLFIDGQNYIGKSAKLAEQALQGTDSSKVEIIIKRKQGSELNSINLIRTKFGIPSIATHFIIPDQKILYTKLLRFSNESANEFYKVVKSYKSKQFNSIVIDLSDNSGGNLDAVINICKYFTAKGDTLLLTKAKNEAYKFEFINDKDGEFNTIPLTVIVNEASASASEVFAGVMQDLDRGLIIGNTTLGKGLVQKSWNYTDTSAFRITVAKYYTPSGRLIQKPYNIDTNHLISEEVKMNMSAESYQQLKEVLLKNGGQLKVPIYHTRKGRTVLGGGGIFPDVLVKNDTLTLLTEVLKSKGIFLEYSLIYLNNNRSLIEEQYSNFSEYAETFNISDEELTSFVQYFRAKNIWNEAMYISDKENIRNQLKAVIAYLIWGDSGYYAVLSLLDKSYQTALANTQKAIEIFNLGK